MKDDELKLEEIEASLTQGGAGRCYAAVMHTQIHQSRGLRQTMPVWVAITDAPVYMRERGGGDREGAGSEALSLLSYTLRYVSLADLSRLCLTAFRTAVIRYTQKGGGRCARYAF